MSDVVGAIVLMALAAFVVTYSMALFVLLVGLIVLASLVLTPFVLRALWKQRKAEHSKPTP